MANRGIRLPIGSELDERSATATAQRIQKVFETAGKDASKSFSDKLSAGISDNGKAAQAAAKTASDAYDKMRDSAGKLRVEEEKLQDLRNRGAKNTQLVAQSEKLEAARRAESRALRDATKAYQEYEEASGKAVSGARGVLSGMRAAGGEAAGGFAEGFAGSAALARLGSAGGPIGIAVAGVAAVGFAAGKTFADQVAAGMQTLQIQDTFRAKMGASPEQMQQYGQAAAKAYSNGFGSSVEENLKALQFGTQAGLINPTASSGDLQALAQQMDTVTKLTDAQSEEVAQGTRNFVKTGLVDNYQQAFDLIVAAQQKGLNISGDLLDTAEEYGTTLHAVGLSGAEAFGLIKQMQDAGVRNTDVAADSLKELSINVADGSKNTKAAFEAMGLNADELTRKFAEGGPAAKQAFGEVISALGNMSDPVQQQLVGLALYKTKWEDAKVAIKNANLDTAAGEMGNLDGKTRDATTALNEHTNQWDMLGRNIDTTMQKLQTWLADTAIGKFVGQGLPGFLNDMLNGGVDVSRPTPTGPFNPSNIPVAPTTSLNPLDILKGGSSSPTTTGGLLLPGTNGPLPPGGALPPATAGVPVVPLVPGADAAGAASKSLPDAPVLPLAYSSTAGMAPQVADAQARVDEAKHDQAEKEARVNQLQLSNVATADDIQKAKNDALEAQRKTQQAEQGVITAQQAMWKKMETSAKGFADGMGQIGAALDQDLGISKGLPGIAENLTKFLANLAFAPALGALNAVVTASGGQAATGSGLVGVLAANGAFGNQYTAQGQYAAAQAGSAGSYGSPVGGGQPYGLAPGTNTGGYGTSGPAFPAWVHALEQQFGVKASTYAGHQESDRHEAGYAPNPNHENRGIDWSGTPDAMQNFANYLATIPGSLEQVIFQNPNTGQDTTIAGGQPVSGYYDAGTLAEHENHVHTRQSQGIPLPGGLGAQSSGPVPVTVVNGSDVGGPPGGWSADWLATAQKESGGNWATDTGNGYQGGLQFSPSSWQLAGGQQYAPSANLATPYQQALTAENLLAQQGPGAWPNTFTPGSAGPVPAGQWGTPGIPGGVTGGGGQGPVFGSNPAGPGIGASAGLGAGSGGMSQPSNPGGGKAGLSGAPMDALMGAASGLDMVMPGAGAVAKIGIQEINRAIEFGGQVAGIAAGGVGEFLSVGDNPRGGLGNSWIGKLTGGLAGARPALPNMAGQKPPAQAQGAQAQAGPTANTTNINVTSPPGADGNKHGGLIAEHQAAMSDPPGRQR